LIIITTKPPAFSVKEAVQIAKEHYGMTVSAESLACEIGQNFLIKEEINQQYVLKIANPEESFDALDAQNQVMDLLNEQIKDCAFPLPQMNTEGERIIGVQGKKQYYNARLLNFLPGRFLAKVKPHSAATIKDLGRLFGKIDSLLAGFKHAGLDRYWHWDLQHASDIREYLGEITDSRRRNFADYFYLQFETLVLPSMHDLRRCIIHNDGNDHNILVSEKGRITGLIDFGDMVHSYRIFELAIALAYIMLGKDDPVAASLPFVSGYHEAFPLEPQEIEVLFAAACARLATSVTISAFQQKRQPENRYLSISTDPAWKTLERLISVNPIKAKNEFEAACGRRRAKPQTLDEQSILHFRKKHLGKMLSVSYQKPLKIVRGTMQYLFDDSGNTYLDCVNNVCHVGHCHPHVVRAAQRQMAMLNTNTRYLHDHIVQYARRLTGLMPETLSVCFFVNSGSEANELALRLMRSHTDARDTLVLDHAYHGNTSSVIDISPYKFDGPGGTGKPDLIHVAPLPDLYRGQFRAGNEAAAQYAEAAERVIHEVKAIGRSLAGFIHESVPGVAGQIVH